MCIILPFFLVDAQPKWFHLSAYETNAEALRSRKIIKNLVINDSNGTIQVDPTINFHDLFNSHSAYDKNSGINILIFDFLASVIKTLIF